MKVIPQNNEQEKAVKSLPAIDAIHLNVGEEQAIDIAESVWICARGKLDCYIVDHRDSNNKKYYLTDFTVKQCLTLTQSTEYSFYVIARESSELQVLRYRDLVEVGAETFFCTYTDVWMEAVICQLARRHTAEAQDDSHAYYDNWQKMESSQFIFSRKRMSWCGILKPNHYLGYELESSIDRILLPITLRNGLASEVSQYIQLKTTRELEKENRLLPAFDQFYLLLIDEIFAAKELEKNTDEEALAGSVGAA